MDFKSIIQNSYKDKKKQAKNMGDYIRDDSLSGNRAQVYHNPNNGKTVVSHTGTNSLQDWITDFQLATGNLEKTKRYKHAKKIQQEAERKYGAENINTVSHSLGYALAKNVGQKSNHIYGLNGAVVPKDLIHKQKNDNVTHIRSKGDWVSMLSPLERGKHISLDNKGSINPLKEHSSEVLDRMNEKIIFE